jgi:membrane-bound ClpP family serine protease
MATPGGVGRNTTIIKIIWNKIVNVIGCASESEKAWLAGTFILMGTHGA